MKKIWFFFLLGLPFLLTWGIIWKYLSPEATFKRTCLNSLQKEFGEKTRSLTGEMLVYSGTYLPYRFIQGTLALSWKTQRFFCISEEEKQYSEVIKQLPSLPVIEELPNLPQEIPSIEELKKIDAEISQKGRDEQWIPSTSLLELLEKKKAFHQLIWKRKNIGKTLKNDLAHTESQTPRTESENEKIIWYDEVIDRIWVKQAQIPFFQKETFVQLVNQLLSPQGFKVYCSGSLCDEITFSGHYETEAELDQLMQEVRDLSASFGVLGIVFQGNLKKSLPLRSYEI